MVKLVIFDETSATEADIEIYLLVIKIANKYGVDISGSVEAEEYFRRLLEEFTGEIKNLDSWLEERIPREFPVVQERPRWIQGASWPFANGKPMTFAGQIDLSMQSGKLVSEVYHDDTSIYIFIGKDVSPVMVTQQL